MNISFNIDIICGISHHINPWGDIEPCPIVQFSRESIHSENDDRSLFDKFTQSEFLSDFRRLSQETTRGCIVLERPDLLNQLVTKHEAKDSTARQTAHQELQSMVPRTSQYHPGNEIPERNWYYRMAKRILFNDFGVYSGHDHTTSAAPYVFKATDDHQTESSATTSGKSCCSAGTDVALGVPKSKFAQ